MKEIYWLTRLDNIYSCFTAIMIVSIITTIILMVVFIYVKDIDEVENVAKKVTSWLTLSCCSLAFAAFGLIFTPTTTEALTILGIGGTIEYVQNNETLKGLPDKCVRALDMWVESLVDEERHEDLH